MLEAYLSRHRQKIISINKECEFKVAQLDCIKAQRDYIYLE